MSQHNDEHSIIIAYVYSLMSSLISYYRIHFQFIHLV